MRTPHGSSGLGLLFAICWSAAAMLAQEKADAVVAPSAKAQRGKLLEWKSAQGQPYWYRLPKQLDPKNPPDLLLMLHGTGLNHGWSFWHYPILGDFRRDDIVVSPDGLTPGQGGTFNFVQGSKDGEQIVGLIGEFKKHFPIGRVYLYGHSQGAFFAYWFAGEHPELVDGIVAHAGNVLDVKHGKLAKQKVAIGILHGRADAVVPVECAIRTEKIYREQGYAKLKLEIVEGLTEQSGHWPLPDHVARMLGWLDQVSTQSAAQALGIIASELEREVPDLTTIGEQAQKARKLMAKADDVSRKDLAPQLAAVEAFLGMAQLAHSQRLLADGQVLDPQSPFGSWVHHFTWADRAFAGDPEWRKAMQKPRELVQKHDKVVEKARKALEKGSKDAFVSGLRAFESAFLSAQGGELRSALQQSLHGVVPPDPEAARFEELLAARATAAAEADQVIAAILRPLVQQLRERVPGLFDHPVAPGTDDADK